MREKFGIPEDFFSFTGVAVHQVAQTGDLHMLEKSNRYSGFRVKYEVEGQSTCICRSVRIHTHISVCQVYLVVFCFKTRHSNIVAALRLGQGLHLLRSHTEYI